MVIIELNVGQFFGNLHPKHIMQCDNGNVPMAI
jgi:hypothetical protein